MASPEETTAIPEVPDDSPASPDESAEQAEENAQRKRRTEKAEEEFFRKMESARKQEEAFTEAEKRLSSPNYVGTEPVEELPGTGPKKPDVRLIASLHFRVNSFPGKLKTRRSAHLLHFLRSA